MRRLFFFCFLAWSSAQETLAPTPHIFKDVCFNMGHRPHLDYVVRQGEGTAPSRENSMGTILYAWLEEPAGANCSEKIHNWTVKAMWFPGFVTADFSQEGDGSAELLNGTNKTNEYLNFTWTCLDNSKLATGLVEVWIELPGFQDAIFKMERSCGSPTPATPEGWSAGAIFFFTIFILTLVFCLVGCFVNYAQRGKTGLEIVPGATAFVDCIDRVRRQPRYTPQMDYNAPVSDSKEKFKTSYQADL